MQEYMSLGPTKNDTAVEPRVSGGENEYIHIVSYWEWPVADVLRRRIPRSLCGVALIEDPDRRPHAIDGPRMPSMRRARCSMKRRVDRAPDRWGLGLPVYRVGPGHRGRAACQRRCEAR